MRWIDEITLINLEAPEERVNANGFPNEPKEKHRARFLRDRKSTRLNSSHR